LIKEAKERNREKNGLERKMHRRIKKKAERRKLQKQYDGKNRREHYKMFKTYNYLSTNILIKEKSGKKPYFKTNIWPSFKKMAKNAIKQTFITKNIILVKILILNSFFAKNAKREYWYLNNCVFIAFNNLTHR